MKRKRGWFFYPLIIVALLLCALPAHADIPTMPHAFYGTLTVGGSAASVGTVVTAKVGGVECGSITTTVEGQYGGSGAYDEKLAVTGEIADGATIYFYVGGSEANEIYPFSYGDVTELDLTAEPPGDDTTPPSVTITALTPDPTSDNTPTFTGTATDTSSNISSVEYKVDDGSWTAATASDGAFDSLSEGYTFTTSALADGGHTVYVRATDSATNTTAEASYASDSFTVDAIAPSVTSTAPEANATDVAVGTTVSATFNEAMDSSTITPSSFTLEGVSGSIAYDSGTDTATFTPGADLEEGTTYTVTLSTAITDAAGNPLASAYSWSFTTEAGVIVSIDAPDEAAAGSDFTANVNISEVVDFDGCNYDVSFDASVLQLDDVTSGLIGSTAIPVDLYNEISPGTWTIVQNVPGLTGVSGAGYLAVLHFTVIGVEGDSSSIILANGMLSDNLAQEIAATWVGDSVRVAAADTTPPPAAPSPPPAPPSPPRTINWPVLWGVVGGMAVVGVIAFLRARRKKLY
jgi:hypothetical protein